MTAKTGTGRRNLVVGVVDALRREIDSGMVHPGDKLPSEARLTERFGVSRTVIREAISALRADGLVVSRQGAGVFVLEPAEKPAGPFHIRDYSRISSVIEMLELRVAVEMEAASLAAQRRSPQQDEAIADAARALAQAFDGGRSTEIDMAFHLAIADASNNPRFREFLEMMGLAMIPRAALEIADQSEETGYVKMLSDEHSAISAAISAGDSGAARGAMQAHLRNSMTRYRKYIRQ